MLDYELNLDIFFYYPFFGALSGSVELYSVLLFNLPLILIAGAPFYYEYFHRQVHNIVMPSHRIYRFQTLFIFHLFCMSEFK